MSLRFQKLRLGAAVVVLLLAFGGSSLFASESGGQRLVEAARTGNLAAVRALLASGIDVNARVKYDATPLLVAAQENRLAVVQALIAAHADLEAKTSDLGVRPLDAAADRGHDGVVQALLAAHADIDAAENDGSTALSRAAQAGHNDVVRTLISAHAKIDTRNAKGGTPLLIAANEGHLDVVKTLLAAGADANARMRDRGATALILAAQNDQGEIVQALLRAHADVNAVTAEQPPRTALDVALADRHADVASLLIVAGAHIAASGTKPAAEGSASDMCVALKAAAAAKSAMEAGGIGSMFTDIADAKARTRLQHLTAVASSAIYYGAAASACGHDSAARALVASRDARMREVEQSFSADTRNACMAAIMPVGAAFGAVQRAKPSGGLYVIDGGLALVARARPACDRFYRQDLDMAETMGHSLKGRERGRSHFP